MLYPFYDTLSHSAPNGRREMQESIQGLQLVDDQLRKWLRVYLRTMDPWIITLGDRNVICYSKSL